jgi:hypothetical protein
MRSGARGAALLTALLVTSGLACSPFQPEATIYDDGGSDASTRDASVVGMTDGSVAERDAAPPIVDGGAPTEAGAIDAGADLYATLVLADAPLVYYRLEEKVGATTAVSSVPNSTNATIDPTPILQTTGRIGFGFDFTKSGDLDLKGSQFDFTGLSPFTAEVWMAPAYTDNTYRHAFIKDSNDQGAARQEWGVWLLNGQLGFERIVDGQNTQAIVNITVKQWHHVAAVYDGMQLLLYVDGAVVKTSGDTHSAKPKDKDVFMGTRDQGSSAGNFPGVLDEIAIYAHALSADQIKAHFNAAP